MSSPTLSFMCIIISTPLLNIVRIKLSWYHGTKKFYINLSLKTFSDFNLLLTKMKISQYLLRADERWWWVPIWWTWSGHCSSTSPSTSSGTNGLINRLFWWRRKTQSSLPPRGWFRWKNKWESWDWKFIAWLELAEPADLYGCALGVFTIY